MAHNGGACVLQGDRGAYESINSMFPNIPSGPPTGIGHTR